MAKMAIIGSARSPSNEEFKARIARLSEMPAHTAPPANARKNRPAKPGFPQPPLQSEPEDAPDEEKPEDASDEEK